MIITKKTTLIGLISIVGIVVASLSITFIVIEVRKHKLIEHDPIIVWGDDDFILYNFPGKGTAKNPYRIENYNITTEAKVGITIWNTTAHFIVRNCLVNAEETGIWIESVATETATITKNTCMLNSKYGIFLYDTDGQSLIQNVCTNNRFSIYIHSCLAISLSENECTNSDYGMVILYSPAISLIENHCTNNFVGAYLYFSSAPSFSHNLFSSCTYGLYLMFSLSAFINQNEFTTNNYGVFLNSSRCSHLSENNIASNDYGVFLISSSNSEFTDNVISYNYLGLYFVYNMNSCNATYNLFQDNTGYAIYIEAFNYGNNIHHNSFINNAEGYPSQAYDDSINFWYDYANNEGNFWNDHNLIGSYIIAGSTNQEDLYPLESRPV